MEGITNPQTGTSDPPVAPLAQRDQDELLKGLDQQLDAIAVGVVERALSEREKLLEEQFERTASIFAAEGKYHEASKGYPIMGALFQSLAKVGRKHGARNALGAHRDECVSTFEKRVGKTHAKTINLATADEGGLLVEGTVLELWLDTLRAESVVLSLEPEIVPVVGDQLKVTGFETDPAITWVEEENTLALTTTPSTGERQTSMRKAMSIMPVTVDYRESASPAVLRRLEEMMRAAFAVGFDDRYLNGSGLSNTVKGLKNHITATSVASGDTLPLILDDWQTIMTSVENSNIRPVSRQATIFSPRTKWHMMLGARLTNEDSPFFLREMRAGTFMGFPFRSTTNIPTNLSGTNSLIIHQAFSQFFVGQSTTLDIQWFPDTSYTESGSLVSSMERDTEILRGKQKTATLMPHTNSGYVLTGVTY